MNSTMEVHGGYNHGLDSFDYRDYFGPPWILLCSCYLEIAKLSSRSNGGERTGIYAEPNFFPTPHKTGPLKKMLTPISCNEPVYLYCSGF